MQLKPEIDDINKYLNSSEIIDFEDKDIQKTTMDLSRGIEDEIQMIKTVYEFVRDDISHSIDIGSNKVTYKASDVLKYGHGLCFANSHLFAAILRSLNIPTGFCYQKLEFDDGFGLHGLNVVFIGSINKWIRLDARGNRNGINAQFSLDKEILAYLVNKDKGEVDFPTIYAEPNKTVIEILQNSQNLRDVIDNVLTTEWLDLLEI
jgi:transglutaminase-like putative cysteine protease